MKLRHLFQLLIATSVVLASRSLNFRCSSSGNSDYSSYIRGTIKTCNVENSIDIQKPNQLVTSVNQTGISTAFEGLTVFHKTMHYIPKGLGNSFSQLKLLRIYGSSLKVVERDDFVELTKLVVLNLENNALEVLESNLFEFTPSLKYMSFRSNRLKFVGANIFKSVKSLRSADFYYNSCISDSITSIENVPRIEKRLKESCSFPENFQRRYAEIDNLKSALKTFEQVNYENCDGNLKTATKFLYQLQQKCNEVPTDEGRSNIVPSVLVELTSGDDLWSNIKIVSENTEISIPTLGNENETIREITIDHQQTFFLPTNFGDLFPRLEMLIVTFSGLYEVNEIVFENMRSLKVLNLTGNKLQDVLVPTLDELDDLEVLDLSFNNLASLETAIFEKLRKLKTIKLNDNSLMALDGDYFGNSKNLEAIYLNNNKLKFISANFLSTLKNLELVQLENNVCIDLQHPNVTLAVIKAKIIENCIAPVRFYCKEALTDRNVSMQCSAQLSIKFPKARIENFLNTTLTNVNIFHVADQAMKFLPLELSKVFTELTEVMVVNSSLSTLQQSDFDGLNHLKIIIIIFNNISSIEDGTFTNVPELEYLDLSGNGIIALPSKIFGKLKTLKFLVLAGNKLRKFEANFLPKRNQIQELMLQENELELIETKTLRLVRKAKTLDFTGNECIDVKYEKGSNSSRSMVEISGEIDLNCSGDSSDENY